MLEPLLQWLQRNRWIRQDSIVAPEFSWSGRRVDLATLTRSGVSSAYELKLSDTRRVLYQAALNAVSFDRSFIVTASQPSFDNLEQARLLGLGVLVMNRQAGRITTVLTPITQSVNVIARRRLQVQIRTMSERSRVQ